MILIIFLHTNLYVLTKCQTKLLQTLRASILFQPQSVSTDKCQEIKLNKIQKQQEKIKD